MPKARSFLLTTILCFIGLTSISANIELEKTIVIKDGIQSSVTGTVTDEEGVPLPGASVVVKGTANGAVADFDGNYTINVDSDGVLVFSYVGFKTIEIAVDGRSNIDVSLAIDSNQLDEVIVVGYGTQKKSDLTGAVARADLETFRDQGNTSIIQSLQGTVAGLNVGVTTSAGSDSGLSVRGTNNLSGGAASSPLLVVDGIVYRGSLQDLNPDDVQSIDVLKDASSAAIYGSQAANGVIIVTTRSGKGGDGKPSFNYSTRYSIKEDANALEYGSREDYLDQIRAFNWQTAFPQGDNYDPNFDPVNELDTNEVTGFNNGNNTNWQELIKRSGFVHNHNLSISGNTDRINYFVSGSFLGQEEVLKGDDFQKITGRINLEIKLTDWLKFGTNSFVTTGDYSGIEFERDAYTYSPFASPYDANGELVRQPTGRLQTNPLLFAEDLDEDKRLQLNTVLYTIIDIPWVEGLSYRMNYNNSYRTRRHNQFLFQENDARGQARKDLFVESDWTMDHIISYNKQFNDVHSINATFVFGREERSFESTETLGNRFSNQLLGFHDISLAEEKLFQSGAEEESSLYQMGRVAYNYSDKYFLTGTVRRDGFSGFGKDQKFAVFPSVALGWTISKEDFFNEEGSFNYLKLRASYGESGRRGLDRYSTLALVAQNDAYVFGDGGSTVPGQEVSTVAAPDLKWETTTGINLGLDFGLLNGRISGNMEYYNTNTEDIIVRIDIPSINGFETTFSNLGKVHNSGFELTINSKNIVTEDFQWSSVFNFATNNNEIKSVLGKDDDGDGIEDDLPTAGFFIGEELGAIYGYEIDPDNPIYQIGDTDIPAGYEAGFYRVVDQNNDGSISETDDKVILGSRDPAYRFSILNTFKYKNFTLSAFINSIQGGKNGYLGDNSYWRNNNWNHFGKGKVNGLMPTVIDYWTPDNPNAEYPSLRYEGITDEIEASFYRDRSFVRLQDVSLSYSFDQNILDKLGLTRLSLVASGKNLATWTKWKGLDPEATGEVFDQFGDLVPNARAPLGISFRRPVTRAYTLGINLSF